MPFEEGRGRGLWAVAAVSNAASVGKGGEEGVDIRGSKGATWWLPLNGLEGLI